MTGRRSFLFLQGPVGPFFERLGAALRERGHRVVRVNLNGGDRLQWRGPGAVCYRERPYGWPGFVADLAQAHAITDLVLFGDCRPWHRIAMRVLRRLGVRIHVFEEGYFRPDWVTCERDGVNGHSSLPRDPHFYLDAVGALRPQPDAPQTPVGPSMRGLVRNAITYYGGVALMNPWFPCHRTHRLCSPLVETTDWIRRGLTLTPRRRLAQERQAALLAERRPFFVLALQLDADMQVRRHSRFAGMSQVIAETVRGFARAAPGDARLVVKNHPLDCGRIDFERVLAREAAAAGIEERTVYLDGGDLPSLLEPARGLVTVNSTAGLSSLHRGLPTLVLGKAIYDLPGLTHAAGADPADRLAHFWTAPEPPDMHLYRAFRRVVMDRTQINGGFYTEAGLAQAVPLAANRLDAVA